MNEKKTWVEVEKLKDDLLRIEEPSATWHLSFLSKIFNLLDNLSIEREPVEGAIARAEYASLEKKWKYWRKRAGMNLSAWSKRGNRIRRLHRWLAGLKVDLKQERELGNAITFDLLKTEKALRVLAKEIVHREVHMMYSFALYDTCGKDTGFLKSEAFLIDYAMSEALYAMKAAGE